MIEIVFDQSARGSLKQAQHYGAGPYRGAGHVDFIVQKGGARPGEEELQQLRQRWEGRERKRWEAAVPLGGDPRDVFAFPLGLSEGRLSDAPFGPERRASLSPVWGEASLVDDHLDRARRDLRTVLERSTRGEAVRVWYSHAPHEQCGMCWFLAELDELPTHGPVWLVELPPWRETAEGTLVSCISWGEVAPGEWGSCLPLQKEAPSLLCRVMARHWADLVREDAPLRAVVNGQLCSVPEDFYDPFLRQVLAGQPEEFHQAHAICEMIGRYRLGISDGWIALRMDAMIQDGLLEAVTQAPADGPSYRRTLRKTIDF